MPTKKNRLFLALLLALIFFSLFFIIPDQIIERYVSGRLAVSVRRVMNRYSYFKEMDSIFNTRACLCYADRDIKFSRYDGLSIAGSIYLSDGLKKRPGILLLHGNTPRGRQLPLYRVLATKLSRKGYLVLTIDFPGHGESDDPFSLDRKKVLKSDNTVDASIRYLKTLSNLDQHRIYIIGHSGGADTAMVVGIRNQSIKKIIAIGPPRRVAEIALNPRDLDYFWERKKRTRRTVYNKEFPKWYTKERWLKGMSKAVGMKKYISYFSQPLHKPLMLIDGQLESKADRIYLQDFYSKIRKPKQYRTIPNSNHYLNTIGIRAVNIYDSGVVNQTVDEIDRWLSSNVQR